MNYSLLHLIPGFFLIFFCVPTLADNGGDPQSDLPPTFSSVAKIFQNKKCMDCHIVGGKAEDVPLSSAKDLLNSPRDLVIPFDPDSSGLVIAISPGARKPMPPLKPGYSALTDTEVNLIRMWIKNGAKD